MQRNKFYKHDQSKNIQSDIPTQTKLIVEDRVLELISVYHIDKFSYNH